MYTLFKYIYTYIYIYGFVHANCDSCILLQYSSFSIIILQMEINNPELVNKTVSVNYVCFTLLTGY